MSQFKSFALHGTLGKAYIYIAMSIAYMDFNLNKETFRKMFPFAISGALIGLGLGIFFAVFSDWFGMIFAFMAFLFSYLTYKKKPPKVRIAKNGMGSVRSARKPCPVCGNLTIHKNDCPRRKPKP